jgi:DNA-binding SARP family transcriptional activator
VTHVVAAAGRLLRGLLALAVLIGLLGGVPWLLVWFIGWPLPDHLPGLGELAAALTTPLDDRKILSLLAILAWALWLLFVRDVLVETILTASETADARRGRPRPPQLRPVGPVRVVAAVLVGAIAGAVLLDTLRGAVTTDASRAAAANAAARTQAVAVAPAEPAARIEQPTASGPRPALAAPARTSLVATVTAHSRHGGSDIPPWARDAPGGIHRVVKGDNLWNIAKDRLGDPFRWREIYVLNRGKPQFNGYALTDPDEIHIGWVLVLPAHTPAQPPAGSAGGNPVPVTPPAQPAPPAPVSPPATPASPAPPSTPPVSTTPATPAPSGAASSSATATAPSPHPAASHPAPQDSEGEHEHGISLPSQGWVSLGLAATIAAVAALLRLQRRRRARLTYPIPLRTGPTPTPVPASIRTADTGGSPLLSTRGGGALAGVMPAPPAVPAAIGLDRNGDEISLFALPGPGLALYGDGATAAARAVLAAALATGVTDELPTRPVVVAPANTLAELLPAGVATVGLDPQRQTFDGERLVVVADTAAAVTHLEEEMIHRRRLLDSMGVDSVTELNAGTRHVEYLPPCVVLMAADPRYTARLLAVATHRTALHLHPVIIGALDGLPTYQVAADGTLAEPDGAGLFDGGRLSTLAARDLVDVLAMVAQAATRPETGDEPAEPQDEPADLDPAVDLADIPALRPHEATATPVRLHVLGPVTLATADGPITTGVRSGSRAVLAVLTAHPRGRTYEEMAAVIHPNADRESGINRVRTDLNAVRSLLREATGIEGKGKFIVYDGASSRYRIDPDLIDVDLWRMLSAIDHANKAADDETACLARLREAADCYGGDFGQGQDWPWAIDYATTYRHQLLGAYARIAEIQEPDQPDEAIAALEQAIEYDPVNEELYQRVIRIHGRLGRPDAVRRTMRLLGDRLAELGQAEPSEATRRVAERQLRPTLTGHG